MISQGIRTSIAKKPYIFVIFQGGGGGLTVPTSGSTHAIYSNLHSMNIYLFILLLNICSIAMFTCLDFRFIYVGGGGGWGVVTSVARTFDPMSLLLFVAIKYVKFRVFPLRTIPAAGNGEGCLDLLQVRINTAFKYAYYVRWIFRNFLDK